MRFKTFFLLTLSVFISKNCLSQNNSIYFPQEKIIIEECDNSIDKNACLYVTIENKVLDVIKSLIKKRNQAIDTLKTSISFQLNDLNQIDEDRIKISINDEKLNKIFRKELNNKISQLDILRVENKKPDKYTNRHHFNYHYLADNHLSKISLDSLLIYRGGVIMEVPLFPNQERVDNDSDTKKFNLLIQEHVGYYFNYPKEAQEKGIQGRVSITFIIEKNGEKTNIKTRGPSPLLENEAIRIISKLPKFQPGLQNGIPTRVPYSFPITFKLQ